MSMVSGVVDTIKNPDQFGKCSMNVGGKWYNTNPAWMKVVPSEGDVVEFDDGGRNYIKNLRVKSAGSAPMSHASGGAGAVQQAELPPHYTMAKGYMTKVQQFPVPVDHPDMAIIRQSCLKAAIELQNLYYDQTGNATTKEDIVALARYFEDYCSGNQELNEVMAEMGMTK